MMIRKTNNSSVNLITRSTSLGSNFTHSTEVLSAKCEIRGCPLIFLPNFLMDNPNLRLGCPVDNLKLEEVQGQSIMRTT